MNRMIKKGVFFTERRWCLFKGIKGGCTTYKHHHLNRRRNLIGPWSRTRLMSIRGLLAVQRQKFDQSQLIVCVHLHSQIFLFQSKYKKIINLLSVKAFQITIIVTKKKKGNWESEIKRHKKFTFVFKHKHNEMLAFSEWIRSNRLVLRAHAYCTAVLFYKMQCWMPLSHF